MEVEGFAVNRRGIDLEVSSVDHGSGGRPDGERKGIHDGMRNVKKLDLETSQLDRIFCFDDVQLRFFEQAVLRQLVLYQADREAAVGKDEREGADMVFVTVCEQDGANRPLVFEQVPDIGDNDVHAQQFVVREHDAGVHNDDRTGRAHRHHVHAELAQPA